MQCPECRECQVDLVSFYDFENRKPGYSGLRYRPTCKVCGTEGVSSDNAVTAARRWGWKPSDGPVQAEAPATHYGDW